MASSLRLYNEATPSILVVDDMPSNLELLEAIFQKAGFSVYKASDASSGLNIFANNPVDLAVLDVMMPGMNGFELCKSLKDLSTQHYCPVILLTALNDSESRIQGLEAGADDFISKPFNTSELITKIRSLLKLKELHEERDHSENIIMTLVVAMEARDPYTTGHSTRVGNLSKEFSSFLGFSEKEQAIVRKAGILHDIGKMGISQSILCKPSTLTNNESKLIKKHTIVGEEICRPLMSMRSILPGIRFHHERWDGSGFPDGLAGEEVPMIARMLSILDSFDAMVSARPYRPKKTVHEALRLMASEKNHGQWDPELSTAFLTMMNTKAAEGYQHV